MRVERRLRREEMGVGRREREIRVAANACL